jgi:hypothetical protein
MAAWGAPGGPGGAGPAAVRGQRRVGLGEQGHGPGAAPRGKTPGAGGVGLGERGPRRRQVAVAERRQLDVAIARGERRHLGRELGVVAARVAADELAEGRLGGLPVGRGEAEGLGGAGAVAGGQGRREPGGGPPGPRLGVPEGLDGAGGRGRVGRRPGRHGLEGGRVALGRQQGGAGRVGGLAGPDQCVGRVRRPRRRRGEQGGEDQGGQARAGVHGA